MPKNSDIDSIIQMLRSDGDPVQLKGGQNNADDAGGSEDRTTMVIVLGIIAGLVLGALFYYCVMYMPSTIADPPAGVCESSLKKEITAGSTEQELAPKRIIPNPVELKKDTKIVGKAKQPTAGAKQQAKPVNMMNALFSVASDENHTGLSLAEFAKAGISTSEFKMPSKPLQPSLEAAKDIAGIAGNSSASKLLDANKQLIEATENNRLRQKMMVATDGLAQYKPEVPIARRRGEEANMPLLNKMREVNGEKIRKITKSKEGPGLFDTPMSIYEKPVDEEPQLAIGKQLRTDDGKVGLSMNTVLRNGLPY